jgi:hypothetical protein
MRARVYPARVRRTALPGTLAANPGLVVILHQNQMVCAGVRRRMCGLQAEDPAQATVDFAHEGRRELVGLDHWITPGRAVGLGSSLSDHFGRLPAYIRCLLGCLTVLTRRQMSKDAELLILRLVRLDHPIAASTVWQIPHDAGIDPAPRRTGPTWKQFLPARARGIAADFTTWTPCCCGASTRSPGRHHRAPGRRMDHAGSPRPPDEPGPARDHGQVLDQDRAGQFTSSSTAADRQRAPPAQSGEPSTFSTTTPPGHRSQPAHASPAASRRPDPVDLAGHWIGRKQVLGGLTCEYYTAALPPSVATGNAGHGPNHISEPHSLNFLRKS